MLLGNSSMLQEGAPLDLLEAPKDLPQGACGRAAQWQWVLELLSDMQKQLLLEYRSPSSQDHPSSGCQWISILICKLP